MVLSIEERKRLRENLLVQLYNHYFESGGKALHLDPEEIKKDRETDLAYSYLINKGLINNEVMARQSYLRVVDKHLV